MNKPTQLMAGRNWGPLDRAIGQVLTSGPQLMSKFQIAVCLKRHAKWRAVGKSLKRLEREGWIERLPVLVQSNKQPHTPRRIIVPQE